MRRLVPIIALTLVLTASNARADVDMTAAVAAIYGPRVETAELHTIAHQRAAEIAQDFSHNGMRSGTAEVLGQNTNYADPVAGVVGDWVASPIHDGVLSDPRWTQIGCGSYLDGETWYFACVLSAPSAGEPIAAARTPNPQPVGAVPTAGATPSVVALPDTATATPWRVAVLVYDANDLVCNGAPIRSTIAEAEVSQALATIEEGRRRIEAVSDGALSLTVIRAGTLTDVDPVFGDSCFPGPAAVQRMGDWPIGFDSVYVIYDVDADGSTSMNGVGGIGYECGVCVGPPGAMATFAAAPMWDGAENYLEGEYSIGIFEHEWGHGVGGFYRSTFGETQVPRLGSDGTKLADGTNRYQFTDWRHDWYAGTVLDRLTNDYVGLEPFVWATGTPTNSHAVSKCKNPQSNAKACR